MLYRIYIAEKKLSRSVRDAVAEYQKRLSPFCKVMIFTAKELEAVPEVSESRLHIYVQPDASGRMTISSEAFAKSLTDYSAAGFTEICYFLGISAPMGASPDQLFSISCLSLSNDILLIALVEQIYRGYTINQNLPYHK